MTEWRPFPLCSKYEVSDAGEVRHAITKRVMTGSLNAGGYRQVSFRPDGKYGRHVGYSVHRMVMLTFVGPRPDGHSIDHINRNRSDNRLANLAYIPEAENSAQGGHFHLGRPKTMEHRAAMSRAVTGERHPMAKLTEAQVMEIRGLHANGARRSDLARSFGVSRSMIYLIYTGRCWSHLPLAG